MKARVTWVNGMMFPGEAGSRHSLVLDGAPENGGRNAGIRPIELMLLGLAGCTAFDVALIVKRSRERVLDCVVEAEAERAPVDPKVLTKSGSATRPRNRRRRGPPHPDERDLR